MPENLSRLSYIPVVPQTLEELANEFDRRPLDADLPCAGKPAEAMYSVAEDRQYGGNKPEDFENYGLLRQEYCSQCQFAVGCLAKAVLERDDFGMHGGASGHDKRRIRRDHRDRTEWPVAVKNFVRQMREDPRCTSIRGKQQVTIRSVPRTLETNSLVDIVRSADPKSDVFFRRPQRC